MAVHEKLGLRDDCLATSIDAACNSFLMQLALAEQLVATGRVRHALLVQSCGLSRTLDPSDPQSAWFGDGATAVVVGAARAQGAILGRADVTDSKLRTAVVTSAPGRKWYEAGPAVLHAKDRRAAYDIILGFADYGRRVIDGALAQAGMTVGDVAFFACHQAQIWQRRVAQSYAGLDGARTLDTFGWAGNLAGSNIPLVLEVATRERILEGGDVVAMYGGGAGVTVSGVVARWGD
jgi:3-oxoacyl-[acyl-carrier-protein] synthase-3